MPTLENADDIPHAHRSSIPIDEATERCPWCGQPIDRSEYTRIKKDIEAREQARLEKAEKALKQGFERQVKAEAEKIRRQATKAAEEQVKALMANQEKIINQRLQAQRATLEKAKAAAVSVEKEKFFREKLKLEGQLTEVQKRLQKQTANELGDKA
jgi:DNA repair exonuclease SbcCD ATPase subunit